MKPRHYAERTAVPVAKSKADVEALLQKAGARAIVMLSDDELAGVGFRVGQIGYRFMLALPAPGPKMPENERAQITRARWRALLLVLKAKVESARSGITTLETELLPYALLPTGATVADEVAPRLRESYEGGRNVPLLPGF